MRKMGSWLGSIIILLLCPFSLVTASSKGAMEEEIVGTIPYHKTFYISSSYRSFQVILGASPDTLHPQITSPLMINLTYPADTTGTFTFTAINDPAFNFMVQMLTNGNNDLIINKIRFESGGGLSTTQLESVFFGNDSDLVGCQINRIQLLVNKFEIKLDLDQSEHVELDIVWEILGIPPVSIISSKTAPSPAFTVIIGLLGLVLVFLKTYRQN